ncbi:alpha/beta hydrolase [Archangium violaceum]|uniref:alpha/beta hydrolase n=1 Tax=Archangium violaceum TaxID=83451 RepID=UPI00193B927A|nr:alpha/beta hydrolase [Archangium violaceum]QRK06474.1 alpha/beta hydrolase [Archangium violaceum]
MKPQGRKLPGPHVFSRLAITVAAAAVLHAAPASAQLPPPSGPIIWGGYTQNQIDALYDQNFWDNAPPDPRMRDQVNSDAVRSRYGEPERLQYGLSRYEFLDLYRTKAKGKAPIMVYIHGGSWQRGSARNAAVPAEMFMEAGVHYLALDFVNTLENGGNLLEMAEQVRRAVEWAYRNAGTFGGDRDQLYVSGHSSGGHLCGVVMTTDWSQHGLPADTVKGGVCSSGMFELYPVSLSARASYVRFTPETLELLSPQRQLRFLHAPIVLAYGTNESPEFIRQTRDFAEALKAAGKPHKVLVGVGYNHFEMNETYGNPYGLLGRASLELMGREPHQGQQNKDNR